MRYSFIDVPGGKLPGPFSTGSDLEMRKYILSEFPTPVPEEADLELASMWHEELIRSGAIMPRMIPGFSGISDVYWLKEQLCPFTLMHEFTRNRKTANELEAIRKEAEENIDKYLSLAGF
jgi:hypothetical protein